MKILHCSDWHLGAYVGPQCDDPHKRMENTTKCLDVLVETAGQEKPDIILVCGDIFHAARVWSDRGMIEVRVAIDYLGALGGIAPVMVLYGTPNHDNIESFRVMEEYFSGKKYPYIRFFTSPEIVTTDTKSGSIQVAGLPGFDKGHFRAQFPGLSAEEENKVFTQQLSQIVAGLSAQVDPAIPSILMAHHTILDCELDNGQHVFQTNEVVLDAATLDSSNFDLICLGHIHKAQRVESCSKPVYYAGSIDRFTFNDEGHDKGFLIYKIRDEHHREGSVDFVETPAREFQTFEWSTDYTARYAAGELTNIHKELVKDKVVRILYTCDEATEKALDKKKLERDLYAAGAYYVSEIRPEKIHEVVNRERLHEKLTVEDCLQRYLDEKKIDAKDYPGIITEALGIISKVQDTASAGGHTGIFLPVEIEVRNYRSYAEEKLSFQDIFFAMVNGRNGAGKSSLFMDAIVDCLYEQPREGELTGWVRNGEKSGSISFIFRLGNDTYRVTRTRQRNGKATLALTKHVMHDAAFGSDFDWEDISCQKLADTQQKIIDLLGMDADTFRSCVLIMQDQYGRFMEAKPEDRMSVLANLLGLGVYEQLEEETKKTLTEVNRELRTAKEEVSTLEQEVDGISELQSELSARQDELKTAEATLTLLKEKKDDLTAKVATFGQIINEKARLLQEATNKESLAKEKNNKLDELVSHAAQTKAFLAMEEDLNRKHNELLEAKQQLASMDSKAKMVKDKQLQVNRMASELSSLAIEKSKLERNMEAIRIVLQSYNALAEDVKKLEKIEAELQYLEEVKARHDEITHKISEAESRLAIVNNTLKSLESQTNILNNSNCIDIDRAECGFLRAAKDAAAKIPDLQTTKAQIMKELEGLVQTKEMLQYSPAYHNTVIAEAQSCRESKQQLAALDGDKKLLEVYSVRYSEIVTRITEVGNEKGQLETELYTLKQEIAGYVELQNRVRDLEQSEQQWQQLPAAKKYLETILPQMEELAKEIEQLQGEIQYSRDKAVELSIQVQDFQRYQDEVQSLSMSISDYESTVASYNRQIGSLEERLTALMHKKDVLEEIKKAVNELAERSARLQVLAEAFSQDGIPHQIIRDIIPELESSANEILGQMTGGRMRLEFRTERTLKSNEAKEVATLDIVIIDVDNGELPYLSRSGGQKVRSALAVSFALAMIKASRVGLQLGMMFVDEPPFLDAEGVEAYCSALEAIHCRYPEMRIVAISHDENMKNMFPQQIFVEMTEQGSKVRKVA